MRISGFIANKDGADQCFVGNPDGEEDGPTLAAFVIQDESDRLYDLLVPAAWYEAANDYDPIMAEARWYEQDGEWYLFATSIEIRAYGTRHRLRRRFAAMDASPLSCGMCGRRVGGPVAWGFNPKYEVECATCAKARGSLTPAAFLRLCRRIAARTG